uniref:Uncharacterized protein n=1 Tax=Sphaerodactylus townsendi TaxID=933632 RepID=A0ACB8EDX7_9SAUR
MLTRFPFSPYIGKIMVIFSHLDSYANGVCFTHGLPVVHPWCKLALHAACLDKVGVPCEQDVQFPFSSSHLCKWTSFRRHLRTGCQRNSVWDKRHFTSTQCTKVRGLFLSSSSVIYKYTAVLQVFKFRKKEKNTHEKGGGLKKNEENQEGNHLPPQNRTEEGYTNTTGIAHRQQ